MWYTDVFVSCIRAREAKSNFDYRPLNVLIEPCGGHRKPPGSPTIVHAMSGNPSNRKSTEHSSFLPSGVSAPLAASWPLHADRLATPRPPLGDSMPYALRERVPRGEAGGGWGTAG
ncbi:hypothetical protein M8818_001427 [Zalaria obscura]|uniref:Uncharacterized protein n=1 Tax=Zalaria obscura TaxID=2024903 RepID=A0ACC3SKB8_9PEZI